MGVNFENGGGCQGRESGVWRQIVKTIAICVVGNTPRMLEGYFSTSTIGKVLFATKLNCFSNGRLISMCYALGHLTPPR